MLTRRKLDQKNMENEALQDNLKQAMQREWEGRERGGEGGEGVGGRGGRGGSGREKGREWEGEGEGG